MSVLNQSGEEHQLECPLCMEALEVDDLHFYPCTCGYQICRFCWNRIREGENGLCPACRKAYPENPAEFIPLNQEQVAAIKTEKKAKEQKRRNKTLESRKALANVRVVQKNLVFVVGLPVRLADPEILKRQEYFGKYGKIHKVVINQSTTYAGSQSGVQGPSASAYVTYVASADALRAIQGVNNVTLDGRVLKSSLGTTKYCAHFMKNQPCPKTDCMYLHELGDPKASFTKEEMHAGLHQVYERKLHNQLLQSQREDKNCTSNQGNSSTNGEKAGSKDSNLSSFLPSSVVTSSNINIGNSTKSSKKESSNGGSGLSNAKEAWPSLGSTPPSDSPARAQSSPKPHTGKSQESSGSDSSTSTQTQTKTAKENTERGKSKNKDAKKNKSENKNKQKQISNTDNDSQTESTDDKATVETTHNSSVFDTAKPQSSFLSNELDELESDRHSLLENHDLLDGSEHSLLDDDTHNLLEDTESRLITVERDPILGYIENPLVKSKLPLNGYSVMDRNALNYIRDREIGQISIMEQKGMLMHDRSRAEAMLRQSEVLREQNVMDGRYMVASNLAMESHSDLLGANYQNNTGVHPSYSILLDNQIPNNPISINSLTPNSMVQSSATPNHISVNGISTNPLINSLSANPMSISINSLSTNSMPLNTLSINPMSMSSMSNNPMSVSHMSNNPILASHMPVSSMSASAMSAMSMSANQMAASSLANTLGVNSMGVNAINGGYMMQNQPLMRVSQQMHPPGLMNGYESPQSNSEGRYLAENMDKFFTDFKAQQLRLVGSSGSVPGNPGLVNNGSHPSRIHSLMPQGLLSADRLEMQHQHRMGAGLKASEGGSLAAGDCDDDLDFDPFKETQKALAELIEKESLHTVSSGDSGERGRRAMPPPPPGFGASYVPQPPRVSDSLPHGYSASNAMYTDWTQMDPAIMSTCVTNKPQMQPAPPQQAQFSHHELFARFNTLGLNQPNGVKIDMPVQWTSNNPKLWQGMHYPNIPLPPGFSPSKPAQHPAECIDAK